MKGVLLTAGVGTRLLPVTSVVNKNAIPVYDRPMFYWPLQNMIENGIKEICFVIDPNLGLQVKILAKNFPKPKGVVFKFVTQKRPRGMAHAILQCEKFAKGDSIFVSPGDNVFFDDFSKIVRKFEKGSTLFLRKLKDPKRFGVPFFDKKGHIYKVVEKPKHPKTNWVLAGPYVFDAKVFRLVRKLKPSERGELEITDLANEYIKSRSAKFIKLKGYYKDVGTFNSLVEAGSYLLKKFHSRVV